MLTEYQTLQYEKRLIAQAMFGTIGIMVGALIALLGAAAQSNRGDTLIVAAPVALAGGYMTVVLRIHLLRMSVYLGLIDADVSRLSGSAHLLMAWETSMTGDVGDASRLTAQARRGAALSLLVVLVAGLAVGGVLLWLGTTILLSSAGLLAITGTTGLPAGFFVTAYVLGNLGLGGLSAAAWLRQRDALADARDRFIRERTVVRWPRPEQQQSSSVSEE